MVALHVLQRALLYRYDGLQIFFYPTGHLCHTRYGSVVILAPLASAKLRRFDHSDFHRNWYLLWISHSEHGRLAVIYHASGERLAWLYKVRPPVAVCQPSVAEMKLGSHPSFGVRQILIFLHLKTHLRHRTCPWTFYHHAAA